MHVKNKLCSAFSKHYKTEFKNNKSTNSNSYIRLVVIKICHQFIAFLYFTFDIIGRNSTNVMNHDLPQAPTPIGTHTRTHNIYISLG
jgi:hypothetical protein